MFRAAALVFVLLLAGCAGRDANLIPLSQTGDNDKSCAELHNEVTTLAAAAGRKIDANKERDGGDVALGVVGALLFWPALFAMDVKNADGKEANNLIDRMEYLRGIGNQKDCDTAAWPVLKRYE